MIRSSRLRLATWGGVLVAAIAAFGLALTVLVARAGLSNASEMLLRGEGESLLSAVRQDLLESDGRPGAAMLASIVERRHASGLRYLALGGPHGTLEVEAGDSTVRGDGMRPTDVRVRAQRARLVELLPGPPRRRPPFGSGDGPPGRPGGPPPPPPPYPPPGGPPDAFPPPGPPPLIVLEFEAPVVAELEASMDRTVAVGAVAVALLLVAATLLARSVARDAGLAKAAERDRRLVALGQMSSVMAHELRNPLASLKGHAQLLVEVLKDGTREHEKAARVVREAERLESLTHDLLDFVRDGPLQRQVVATSALVERAVEGLARDRIDLVLTDAPDALFVDEARVAAALSNLVRNALQATSAGEKVSLSVQGSGQDALFEVRDHGEGVAPADAERLFEPFFTTRARGTGLGLAVARRVVDQHGGTLRGVTHPEGGALFSIRLPDAARPGSERGAGTR